MIRFCNSKQMGLLWFTCLYLAVSSIQAFEFRVPNVRPVVDDDYICTSRPVPKSEEYLTAFDIAEHSENAHHIMLFLCDEPGKMDASWRCSEMFANTEPTCKGMQTVVFAWAMKAPNFKYPPNISAKVGGPGNKGYLVLQVHYKTAKKFKHNPQLTDNSGLIITSQKEPTDRIAGIYLLLSDGTMPAGEITYLDMACRYSGTEELKPFAFRVHSHFLGEATSGWQVKDRKWNLIGIQSPKNPQTARCVMDNRMNDEDVDIGYAATQEMCNFYFMYSVPRNSSNTYNYCFTDGSKKWTNYFEEEDLPQQSLISPKTGELLVDDRELLTPEDDRVMMEEGLAYQRRSQNPMMFY